MEGSRQVDARMKMGKLTCYMMAGCFFAVIVGYLPRNTGLSGLWCLLIPAIIHLIVGYSYSCFCHAESRLMKSGVFSKQRYDTKFWFLLVSVQTCNTMIRFMLDQKSRFLSEVSAQETVVTFVMAGSVCLVLIIPCFFDIGLDSRIRYVEITLPAVFVWVLGITGFRQMYDACLIFEIINFVITIYLLVMIFRLYPFDKDIS